MDLSFGTLVAFLLHVTAACCAPAGYSLQDGCAAVQNSSLELNHVARIALAQNRFEAVAEFSTSLAWMEAKDMCDPGKLKQDPSTCIGKILDVLTSYKSAVERVAAFAICSARVRHVSSAIQRLRRDISTCVKSRGDDIHDEHNSIEEIQPISNWEKAPLCQYTLDRLFSFSIVAARVFARGDPAHHTGGSTQMCV